MPKYPATPAHDERYRKIIASATEVFFTRGFAAGTTKEIAERIGLTQPALYHYVGGKDDLLAAIALSVRDKIAAIFERASSMNAPAEQRLRTVISEYTAVMADESHACAVYWDERKHVSPEVETELQTSQRGFLDALEGLVRAVQRDNLMVSGDPAVLAQGIIGMTSWTYRWYRPEGTLGAADIAALYCAMLGI